MTEIFKANRRLLYRTLWKLGGKFLVEELNNKRCGWARSFSSIENERMDMLSSAFRWKSSKQGFNFWGAINKRIQND